MTVIMPTNMINACVYITRLFLNFNLHRDSKIMYHFTVGHWKKECGHSCIVVVTSAYAHGGMTHLHARAHTHTRTHAHIHTHVRAHTHTRACVCVWERIFNTQSQTVTINTHICQILELIRLVCRIRLLKIIHTRNDILMHTCSRNRTPKHTHVPEKNQGTPQQTHN